MKISSFKLPSFFRSSPPINIDVPVCKSVSHFNWFARYAESGGIGEHQHFSK
jgi:hypothetical protein